MKIFSQKLILSCLSVCLLYSGDALAASKPASPSKAAKTQPNRPKWEYCFVVGSTYENQKNGVTAYLPGGKLIHVPFKINGTNHVAVAKLLNILGDQGFEVVAYQVAENGHQSWTLKRRK